MRFGIGTWANGTATEVQSVRADVIDLGEAELQQLQRIKGPGRWKICVAGRPTILIRVAPDPESPPANRRDGEK